MSKWREVRLEDISEYISRGVSPKYVDEGILVLNQKCIRDFSIGLSLARFTSRDKRYPEYKFLRYGDILVNSTGTGTLGRVSIYLGNEPILVDSHITIVRVNEAVSSKFLAYYLHLIEDIIITMGRGATNQQELNKTVLEKLKIKIPDLKTQEKIADILSTYDELIENNNRRIEILEKTAEEIYKEWFVRMRFPGHESTKFIKGIPEGWEVRKFINKEVKLISSGINKFEGLKRYMATADVEGISLKHGEDITFTERPSRANMQPKENTIWFAKMQYTIKHLYFRNHSQKLIENIILSTGFAGIEFKNINHYYYYLSFIRYGIFEDIKDMYANGSTQVAINNQNIKRIRLLMPDKELLNAFNNIAELNFEMIEKYKEQNQKLIKQRDLLLPRLMNGTIEVN